MVKINCPKDYNWWYILANAGIDPVLNKDKYSYDEKAEILTVDVSQDILDKALAEYDHDTWLKELEQLSKKRTKEDYLLDLDFRLSLVELGLI